MNDEEELDEDDNEDCPRCGGPIYTQPHWHYYECDDCGWRQKKEREYD